VALVLEIKVGPFAGKKVTLANGRSILTGRAVGRTNFGVSRDAFSAILEPTAVRTILTYLGLPDKPPELAPARIPEQSPLHTTGGERPSCGAQFA